MRLYGASSECAPAGIRWESRCVTFLGARLGSSGQESGRLSSAEPWTSSSIIVVWDPYQVVWDPYQLSRHVSTLRRRNTTLQDDQMANERPQASRQDLQVFLALREEDGCPPLPEGVDHVVDDEPAPRLIGSQRRIERLDAEARDEAPRDDGGLAHDQSVLERPASGLSPGIHGEPDRTERHLEDRVETIAPARRCRQPRDEARLHLGQDALERRAGTW